MNTEKIKTALKNWNSIFCSGMVCKTNVKRDIVVVLVAILLAAGFLYSTLRSAPQVRNIAVAPVSPENSDETSGVVAGEAVIDPVMTEEDIAAEVEKKIGSVDSDGWKTYNNQFWGFTVKYPGDWLAPKSFSKSSGSQWEVRYQFRKNDTGDNPYGGFDVVVYDVPKTKELANTDEYPKIKSGDLKAEGQCQNIEGHAIDVDDFPAEEIYIPPTDDCYNSALFFSIIKDRYIYNIVPVLKEGSGGGSDPRISINDDFPEYYLASSTLSLINIVRLKPVPPKPKITAPKPVSYKVVGGKLVCAKKNDNPRKSKKNKPGHLDMECCLDPDEKPNPWCTY